MGDLRHGIKSDLMSCVQRLSIVPQNEMPDVDAKIVDGSVVVNMLQPKASSTFGDYAADVFLPYLIKLLRTSSPLDVVWDRYIEGSSTREKRGSVSRSHSILLNGLKTFICQRKAYRSHTSHRGCSKRAY